MLVLMMFVVVLFERMVLYKNID